MRTMFQKNETIATIIITCYIIANENSIKYQNVLAFHVKWFINGLVSSFCTIIYIYFSKKKKNNNRKIVYILLITEPIKFSADSHVSRIVDGMA